MLHDSKSPCGYRTGLIVLMGLFALAACQNESAHNNETATKHTSIQIHAGAKTGAYGALVRDINLRAADMRESCAPKWQSAECRLAHFEFKSACGNGGSTNNLKRLGMPPRPREETPPQRIIRFLVEYFSHEHDPKAKDADCGTAYSGPRMGFALVQNFFVYGAAAKGCEENNSEQCRSKAANTDLDNYGYFKDLRTVLPVSYGRIQIIVAGTQGTRSATSELEDLKGKRVYLGGAGGVNEVHGREVLRRHPLVARTLEKNILSRKDALDELAAKTYMPREKLPTGQKDLGNLLLACGVVEAYVISGEVIEQGQKDLSSFGVDGCRTVVLRQLAIPDVIIDGMVSEFPYYQRVASPPALQQTKFDHSMPAVTTYLVTTTSTPAEIVKELTEALHADWRNLMLLNDDLVPLEENIYKQPAPFHVGARAALQDAGLLGKDPLPWYWALAGVLGLFAFFYRTEISYDRLGEKRSRSPTRFLTRLTLIAFGTIMLFLIVVKAIRYLEGAQAANFGTDNPIANKGFGDVLLWMFTFVSSGYENDVFPSAPESIMVVGLFAMIGIALPIWLIVKVVDHMREAKLDRERGGESRSWLKQKKDQLSESLNIGYRSKGVLLLCGWNSKAPGLVYTMTCPDSPYPGIVNIIADMDVEYPIQHWHFNKKRVRFYRGDASRRSMLERADGLRADNALILADFNAESRTNTAGMLTALAINKMRENRKPRPLNVSAEMTLKKDDLRFLKAHVNNIVDPELIAERMIAVAAFNKHVLTFVLDALSPDDRSEWYSVPSDLIRPRPDKRRGKMTIGDYQRALQEREIVLVGVCSEESADTAGDFSPDFEKDSNLNPLVEHQQLQHPLPPDSYLVCAATNPQAFSTRSFANLFRHRQGAISTRVEATAILPLGTDNCTVLIIGQGHRVRSLQAHLDDSIDDLTTDIVDIDRKMNSADSDKVISDRITGRRWTHFILLSAMPESRDESEYSRHSKQADSETILRANLIRTTLAETNPGAVIAAELHNPHSRRMAEDAGVTTVVSNSLLVERFLARLACGRGHVSEMLMAMLSVRDGICLRSIELDAGHPLIGRAFGDVLNTWFLDGRVLGLLPYQMRQSYENEGEDFGTHFAMCPTSAERDLKLAEKDVVIVLGNASGRASSLK